MYRLESRGKNMKKTYSVSIVGAGSRYTPGILKMLVNEKI